MVLHKQTYLALWSGVSCVSALVYSPFLLMVISPLMLVYISVVGTARGLILLLDFGG